MGTETESMDFSGVTFPSDRLTVGSIRRQFGFDGVGDEAGRIDTMLDLERSCIEAGFRIAGGEQETDLDYSGIGLRDAVDDLANLYIRFGIADGVRSAELLINELKGIGASRARWKRLR
jgi:hypothetical protein